MQPCDVLIVGGGPAGSSLAWALQDSGLSVTVLDKADFPRDKVCAGWITPGVVDDLQLDLAGYAREHTLQPILGFRVRMMGRREVETLYAGEAVSFGIRRCEFDTYLLHRSGANLALGHPLRSLERDGDGWLANGEFRARLVVGAGGHFCPVARAVGAKPPGGEMVVAAQEVEFEMTPAQEAACTVEPEIPELFFMPDLLGYGWVFRKGRHLNVGLGREDSSNLSEHVRAFCSYLRESGKVPFDPPDSFHGHAYLLYSHTLRDVVMDGLLLVGDAAGMAYAESGEGIRPAIESGLLAARVIDAAGGDYRQNALLPYAELLDHRFGRRQAAPGLLERIPPALKQLAARRLMESRWFVRSVLVERWFLRRHEPPLAAS